MRRSVRLFKLLKMVCTRFDACFFVTVFLLCKLKFTDLISCPASPSSPSPVTQQMTAMSISQDSGAVDSDRAEAEDGEEEGTSNSTGKHHRKSLPTHSPHRQSYSKGEDTIKNHSVNKHVNNATLFHKHP